MNHLLRGHAPISDGVWKELDEEATRAARRRRWRPASSSTSRARTAGSTRRRTSDASSSLDVPRARA